MVIVYVRFCPDVTKKNAYKVVRVIQLAPKQKFINRGLYMGDNS